mmetsp:Transcript_16335/g.19850  ORF Transcript_16335/g.19850 Transcript_16335/m.19850 type:complete len:381 (+) Transcript_16335:133-1275(+)
MSSTRSPRANGTDDDNAEILRHYKALFFHKEREREEVDAYGGHISRGQQHSNNESWQSRYQTYPRTEPQFENFVSMNTSTSMDAQNKSNDNRDLIDKYKVNIVPNKMRRSTQVTHPMKSDHSPKKKSVAKEILETNSDSTLAHEEIPAYFSPASLLLRTKDRDENQSTVSDKIQLENEESKSGSEELEEPSAENGEIPVKEIESKLQGELEEARNVIKELEREKKEIQKRLSLAESKLVEQDIATQKRCADLEAKLKQFGDLRLDSEGRTVSMHRQLTDLTAERQESLLTLRRYEDENKSLSELLVKKDETIAILKEKDKLLLQKLDKSEQKRVELQSEIEAERTAMANTDVNKILHDSLCRIGELEALNHSLKESIAQL